MQELFSKKILILGGSRFAGRVFCNAAQNEGYEVHIANRGRLPLNVQGVSEYICERSNPRRLSRIIPDGYYEAIVDFSNNSEGDVFGTVQYIGARADKYILISCALNEKKQSLESELWESIDKYAVNTAGTVLRPGMIYGEYNYLEAEGMIIEKIAKRHVVTIPLDATAGFNFIYVRDLARAVLDIIRSTAGTGKTYNIAQPVRITYNRLFSDFERFNGGSFETEGLTVDEIIRRGVTLPFPLTEDCIVDGAAFTEDFNFEYTPFSVGMENTFNAIYRLYN